MQSATYPILQSDTAYMYSTIVEYHADNEYMYARAIIWCLICQLEFAIACCLTAYIWQSVC